MDESGRKAAAKPPSARRPPNQRERDGHTCWAPIMYQGPEHPLCAGPWALLLVLCELGLILSFAHSPMQGFTPSLMRPALPPTPQLPLLGHSASDGGQRKGCLPISEPEVKCWLQTNPSAPLAGSKQLHQPGSQDHKELSLNLERGSYSEDRAQPVRTSNWHPCRPHCLHWWFANYSHNLLVCHETNVVNHYQHF